MKNIVKVMLQEGLDEATIHEVLNVLEASGKFKAEKINNAIKKIDDYKKAIDDVEKDHPNFSKEGIGLLKDDQARMEHNVNSRIDKVYRKEMEIIKRKENQKKP